MLSASVVWIQSSLIYFSEEYLIYMKTEPLQGALVDLVVLWVIESSV